MSADVKCALCSDKAPTSNLRTGYLGYCRHCNIYWHSKCHVTSQCPHCSRYTK
jgi:hypothetical protein